MSVGKRNKCQCAELAERLEELERKVHQEAKWRGWQANASNVNGQFGFGSHYGYRELDVQA